MKTRSMLIVLVFLFSGSVIKAGDNLPASQAAFVYNFLRYIKWPDKSVGDNFVITIYGNSDVYKELTAYTKTRKFGMKPIVVNRTNNLQELADSQIIFVSEERSNQIASLKQKYAGTPTLIISEKKGSLAMGSTIELLVQNNRLGFRIDERAARQQQLVISRELLKLASI